MTEGRVAYIAVMSLLLGKSPVIHRLYIDDSGEKEYGEKTSRYFVYAGVVLAADKEAAIVTELTAAKERTFGTRDVELKSNWLRIPREREKRYLKPYGISDAELTAFVDWLWGWMKDSDLSLVAAVIDKPQMKARYATPWHPSATAYQFLLQRYQKHLERTGGLGQVTVDSMDGASPALNQWRDLLRTQHRRLKKDGCSITKLRFTHVAEELRFGNSARFNQLQLADLAAYNVFRQFRDHGENWDAPELGELPMYEPLKRILPRFLRGPAPKNQLEGWGVVKWPNQHDGKWCLTPEELRGA